MASLSLATVNQPLGGGAPPLKEPSLPKTTHLSVYTRSRLKLAVSCKAGENNNMVDRRNMLIGLYGAAATATIMGGNSSGVPAALAAVPVAFPLDSVKRVVVERPRKSRSKEEKAVEEEVVVVGLELSHTDAPIIKFDVYINDDNKHDIQESREITPEYAGSFSTLPMNHDKMSTNFNLGLNRIIERLGVEDDDTLVVSLVPRAGNDAIVVTDVKMEYLRD